MQPLNRAERNNAFLGFVFFLLVTIGIVVTVAFFSIKVPFIENERLRHRMLVMQHEKNLSDSFRVAMNVTLSELARFDSKQEPAIVTNLKVQAKIKGMSRLIKNMPEEMSNDEKSIYDLIIQNLADLNEAKTRLRTLEDEKK